MVYACACFIAIFDIIYDDITYDTHTCTYHSHSLLGHRLEHAISTGMMCVQISGEYASFGNVLSDVQILIITEFLEEGTLNKHLEIQYIYISAIHLTVYGHLWARSA